MPTDINRPVVRQPPRVADQRPIISNKVVIGAGLLMLFSVVVAGIAHRTGSYHITMPPTSPIASRDLLFADQHDGGVLVTDAKTGARVAVVEPKTGGFIRGIMRGLVREHRLNEQTVNTPFRLTHWADGRLSIADPSTGESFDLEAFGSTNEAAFARFLEDKQADATTAQGAPTSGSGARTR